MNGPLQERTSVLESDSSSATKFPEDYDTDLELEWANPSNIRLTFNLISEFE